MAELESDPDPGPSAASAAAALLEEYRSSLEDLTFNSKPHINMLTILAEENLPHAPLIVTAIEAHSSQAPPTERLPAMYLMDSIIKNVGRDYLHLFTHNIVSTFVGAFEKVDESTRKSLFKLRSTWDDIFPLKKLYALDVRVNTIDPAWPIKALPPNINTSSIHVNPKFLNKVPEETADVTTAPSVSAAPANLDDAQEQIRQQLLAKQKQLLELERKKLELDLEQTKAQLAQASLGLNDPLLPPIHSRLLVKPTISSTVLQSPSSAASKSVETEQSTAEDPASVKDPGITSRDPGTNRKLRLEPRIGHGEEMQHVSVSDRLQVSPCGTAGKARKDHQFTASNKLSSNRRVKITQINPLREQDRIHQLINELTAGTGKSKSLSPLKSRPCDKESLAPERNEWAKLTETNSKRDPRLNPQTKVKSHRKVEDTKEKKRNDLKGREEEHDKSNPRSVRNKSSKRTEAKGEQDGKHTEWKQGYKQNSSRRSRSPQSPSAVSHSFKSRQRHSPIRRRHSASPSHSTLRDEAGPAQRQHPTLRDEAGPAQRQHSTLRDEAGPSQRQKPGKRSAHRTKHSSEPHDRLTIKRQKMAPEERHEEQLDTNYDYVNSPKFSPEPPEEEVGSWSKAPPPKKRKSQSQWDQVKRQQQDAEYVDEGRPALQQRDACWSRRNTSAIHQQSSQNSLSVDPDLQIPKELTRASKGNLLKKANRSFQAGNLSNEQFLQIAHGINQLFQYQETQQKSESGARHRNDRGGEKTSRSACCAAPERSPPDIDLTEAVLSYYEHKSKLVRTKLQPLLSSRAMKDLEGAKASYRDDGPGDRSTRHSSKGQTQNVRSASPGYGQGKRQQDKSKSRSPACEVGDPAAKSKRQCKQENEARVDRNSERVRASQARCGRNSPKHKENRSLYESGQGHRKESTPPERRSLSSREGWVSHQEKRAFSSGASRHSPPVSDQKYAPLLKGPAASEWSPLREEPGPPEQESHDENIFAEELPYERGQLQPGLDHFQFAEGANYKPAYERVQLSRQRNGNQGEQWKEAPGIRPFNMDPTFQQDQRLTGPFEGVDREQLNVHDRGDRRKLESSADVGRLALGPVYAESPAGTGRVQCERASATPWLGAAVYREAECVEGSMFPLGQHSDRLHSEDAHRSHTPHARLACRIHQPPEPKFGVLTRPDGSHPHRLEASPGSCFDRPLSPSFDQAARFVEAPGPCFDSGQGSLFNGSPGSRFGITCGPVIGPGQHCGNEIVQRPEGIRGQPGPLQCNPKLAVEQVVNSGNAASVPVESLLISQPMCNTVPMDIISDHAAPPYNQDTLYFMPVPYRPAAATQSHQPGLQENHLGQLDINELFEKLVATGILSTKKTESISPDTKPHPAPQIQQSEPTAPEEEEEEEENDEELPIPDITGFALDDLKQRYDGVINRLYTGIQCYSCGIRFTATQTDLYADHLDWHYRRKRLEQETVKRSTHRKWYYSQSDWIEFEEVCDLEDRAKSQDFESENEEVILNPQGITNHEEFVSVGPGCAGTQQISYLSCDDDNKDGSISEYTPVPISTAAESPLTAVLTTLKHEPSDHGCPDPYNQTSYNIKKEPSGLIVSDIAVKKEGIKAEME